MVVTGVADMEKVAGVDAETGVDIVMATITISIVMDFTGISIPILFTLTAMTIIHIIAIQAFLQYL